MKKLFSKGLTGGAAFFILTLIVIAHLTITYVAIERNKVVMHRADRDEVIQKIINTIQLVEATPTTHRVYAVHALADPELHVSLTNSPAFELKFTELSFWTITQALRNNLDSFEISILLDHGQWLNLHATVYSHFLLMQFFLIILEIIVFGAVLFAAWSINRFTGPLENFKRAADKLGMDLHAKPLAIYGPNIVRKTAQAMNTMQQRIQELIRDRTLMLAAISHDLRTPITRLKLRAQFIENEELHAKIIDDLDEMESMIAQTLSFAREDYSSKNKSKLDLASLIQSLCDEMQDIGSHVSFKTRSRQIAFFGRRLALKRAFSNLISNAIKYGHFARVEIETRKKEIIITIQDNGPGIPEEELTNVLQPFYRVDASRSRSSAGGGVGLGLAVAKEIITHHNGTIQLTNAIEGGLKIIVTFPTEPNSNKTNG